MPGNLFGRWDYRILVLDLDTPGAPWVVRPCKARTEEGAARIAARIAREGGGANHTRTLVQSRRPGATAWQTDY